MYWNKAIEPVLESFHRMQFYVTNSEKNVTRAFGLSIRLGVSPLKKESLLFCLPSKSDLCHRVRCWLRLNIETKQKVHDNWHQRERYCFIIQENPLKANFLITTSPRIKTTSWHTFPRTDLLLINWVNSSIKPSRFSVSVAWSWSALRYLSIVSDFILTHKMIE